MEAVVPKGRRQTSKDNSLKRYESSGTDPAFTSLNRGALKRAKTKSSEDTGSGLGVTLDEIEKGLASSARRLTQQREAEESMDSLLEEKKQDESICKRHALSLRSVTFDFVLVATEEEMKILAPSREYQATHKRRATSSSGRSTLSKYFRSSRKKSKKKPKETEIRSVQPIDNYISKKRKKALKDLEDFDV